jgi:RNA polymerase subunit RPABC4/transcription elongation factor Spt4
MTNCPNCSNPVLDSAKFCPECGKRINLNCTSCGYNLTGQEKHCPECGHPYLTNRNSSGQGGYTGNEEGNPLIKLPEIPSGENLANRYLIK